MDKVYLLAEWYYGDTMPYYEVKSVHLGFEEAKKAYEDTLGTKIEVEQYEVLSNAVLGSKYRRNESSIEGNELFVYEVNANEKLKLTYEDKYSF